MFPASSLPGVSTRLTFELRTPYQIRDSRHWLRKYLIHQKHYNQLNSEFDLIRSGDKVTYPTISTFKDYLHFQGVKSHSHEFRTSTPH